ncbi:MAG: PfkB family carbohydrate kinase [Cyanobacteriota bacterium]|nr:PfkB family carbohydrate kinase [Cyanobacteriota bacterium]
MVALDLIYRVDHFPQSNEKLFAEDCAIAAGGPATNAAVTFSLLGDRATLWGAIGRSPTSTLVREDLATQGVRLIDLAAETDLSPPMSSIIVTKSSGDRAVVSLKGPSIPITGEQLYADLLSAVDIILFDGHQLELSRAIAPLAKAQQIPIVLDGGSWKPNLDQILPFVDYAVCSADFYPPSCRDRAEVFAYLVKQKIPYIAITQGEKPLHYWTQKESGTLDVPKIKPVDTLGAGDIFHGAFCHYILDLDFLQALSEAAKIATLSCQFIGTRAWRDRLSINRQ